MICFLRLKALLQSLGSILCPAIDLAAENILLRQQIVSLEQQYPRPGRSLFEPVARVSMHRIWKKIINAFCFISPRVLVKLHQKGFRLYWAFICRRGRRKENRRIAKEIRELIGKMAHDNVTWGALLFAITSYLNPHCFY